jgi:hypothetical protein
MNTVLKNLSTSAGCLAWISIDEVTAMLSSEEKQKMIRAVRNESKLALGVVIKCAAALLTLELLVHVVTAAGLRMDGAMFPLGASPVPTPPAFVNVPPPALQTAPKSR